MNETISPTTRATPPNTAALVASTNGRLGTAASVARMVPVEYSEVMISTPRTPMAIWPRANPDRLRLVGSYPTLSADDMVAQWEAVSAQADDAYPNAARHQRDQRPHGGADGPELRPLRAQRA